MGDGGATVRVAAMSEVREGAWIACQAGGDTCIFIPAPVPPENPYASTPYPTEDERWEWRRAIEKWEHQMEYYNSTIEPLGL